ncbi:hypothetical protein WDW89_22345 [Deltaproteobacteria bacterium TL4]
MKIILQPFTFGALFKRAIRIYTTHWIPMLLLTFVFLIIPWVLGTLNLSVLEFFSLYLAERLLEAAMTLGLLSLMVSPVFPVTKIINYFRSPRILGAFYVATLQFVIFIFGMTGLSPVFAPFNIIVVFLWIGSIFAFSLAQPVYITEGLRGVQALARSLQILKPFVIYAFFTIMFIKLCQVILPGVISIIMLPDLNFSLAETPEQVKEMLLRVLKDPESQQIMRWSQYLAILVFDPFVAIILSLLYLNFIHIRSGVEISVFSNLARGLLGLPTERAANGQELIQSTDPQEDVNSGEPLPHEDPLPQAEDTQKIHEKQQDTFLNESTLESPSKDKLGPHR